MRKIFSYTGKDGITTYKVRFKLDGRTRSKTFPSEDEADQFDLMLERWGAKRALEFIHEPVEPKRQASGVTVNECVSAHIAMIPEEGTRNNYEGRLRNHIQHTIGEIRANELTLTDVQLWLNAQSGTSNTILSNKILLSAALNAAVERGQIPLNPAAKAKVPRRPRNEGRAPLTPHYSRDEFRLICKAMSPIYALFVEFLGESGCRIGEAAALLPSDINLKTGQVNITKTFSLEAGNGYVEGPLKTEKSRRTIRVNQSLLEQLDLSGPWLFTNAYGNRIQGNAFGKRHWQLAMIKSGLPEHRQGHPHDLRHAHANWLLEKGVSIPAISARLGHATPMTTLNMYGHPAANAEDTIMAALDDC